MLQSHPPTPARALPERAMRTVTVLLNAGVMQGERDGLCRIRNVSDGGLTVETSLPLIVGEPAWIALRTGETLWCIVRWSKDRLAGMSCRVDPAAVIAATAEACGPVLPRFPRRARTEVIVSGIAYPCRLDSISLSDVLATHVPVALRPGQLLSIGIDGLGMRPATVRIGQGGELFARFAPSLSFASLDAWLVRHPHTGAASATRD